MDLAGRVALITGASRGLGKAMALALAPAGVGRSSPATAGSAAVVLARAVADWDGVIAGVPRV